MTRGGSACMAPSPAASLQVSSKRAFILHKILCMVFQRFFERSPSSGAVSLIYERNSFVN